MRVNPVIHQHIKPFPLFTLARLGLALALAALMLTNVAASTQVIYAATTYTIAVDSVDDDNPNGGCTLREAIALANSGAGAGAHANGCTIAESGGSPSTPIVYEINLPSYTYTLSGAAGEDENASGDLDISANVVISGAQTTISGGGIDRVFHIDPTGIGDVTVSIFSLVIQDGYVTFGDNNGGGIYNNNGMVYIADSTLSGNQAVVLGGGIYNQDGTVSVTASTLSGNQAGVLGGGVYNKGSLSITDSTILANTSAESGGIRVYADSSGSATTTIRNSAVISNTAGDAGGGGIQVWASPKSTVTVTLDSSIVSHNHSDGDGGGIQVWASESTATVTLDNSTLSGNSADASGGGIHLSGGTVNLNNVTITDNTADDDDSGDDSGGGICVASGEVHVKNSIVAGNHDKSGTGAEDCSISGTFNSQGYNLTGDGAGCPGEGTGDQVTADPRLATLSDNGGGTPTHALLSGSPAIDTADCMDMGGSPVTADQRGVSRPMDGDGDGAVLCDVGAYEAVPLSIRKTVTPTDAAYHGVVTYTVLLSNGDLVDRTDVSLTDTLPSQVDFSSWAIQPSGTDESGDEITWGGRVLAQDVITFAFIVTHTGDYGDVVTNTAEYRHAIGSGSASATFTVEPMNFIYLPVVLRNT